MRTADIDSPAHPPASVASAARAASSSPGKSCTAGSRGWALSATRWSPARPTPQAWSPCPKAWSS